MKRDENAYVLDYLPKGKQDMPSHKRKPLVQAVGDIHFSLLELNPKQDKEFEIGERLYIGDNIREKIDRVERRIKYEWLTPTAKSELPHIVEKIVSENEGEYVGFFNTASSLTTRLHKLETLPKIGKKHREEILEEREIAPFQSFSDMKSRLSHTPDPKRLIVDKVIEELKGDSKYHLFTMVEGHNAYIYQKPRQ
jgi:putative nucleotide binding protein